MDCHFRVSVGITANVEALAKGRNRSTKVSALHNLTLDSYLRLCGALKLRPYLIALEDDDDKY